MLQSLVELFLLLTKLGYLSFEGFNVLLRALSDNALGLSVICPFPLKLGIRESIDTSSPNSRIRRSLSCGQTAGGLLLGRAPGALSRRRLAFRAHGALHDAYSGFGGGKKEGKAAGIWRKSIFTLSTLMLHAHAHTRRPMARWTACGESSKGFVICLSSPRLMTGKWTMQPLKNRITY